MAALALALICASARAAVAEIDLQAITWQAAALWQKGKPGKPQDIAALPPSFKGRVLAKLKLLNRGPKETDAIVLRYSVTPKVAPKDKKDLGVWAVPVVVEERRVAKVGANQIIDVPIDVTSTLDLNFKRLASEGYAASDIKIDVMLVPRRGDDEKINVISSTLPVSE